MNNIYKKIILNITLLTTIIVFALWGMGDIFSGGKTNIVAEIGSEKIYTKDLISKLRNLLRNQNNLYNKETKDRMFDYALTSLISEKIFKIYAEKNNISINDQALSYYIQTQKEFFDNDKFSRTKYEKFLLENNITSQYLENTLKEKYLKEIILSILNKGLHPTTYHYNLFKKEFLKEMSLKYIELNNKVIPEDEVLKFFNENKKNFSLGEMRKGQFSLIPNKDKKNDDYYKLISSIENDIIKNTDFDEINKKYNLISKSTEFVNKNSLNINFRESGDKRINETLFKLSLEVSNELVQVDDQYFLVHLDEIKNNLIPSLNNTIAKTIKNEISIKKNLEEAKKIVEKNPSNFNALQNYALNNKNNIKNLKISRSNMSSNKFSKSNLDLIYKAKENQNLYLIDEEKVYLVYVEKISEIKNYDKNLEEIFNASVISQFDKLIIYDFENYINKQFKIKFNQKTIDRLKSNI